MSYLRCRRTSMCTVVFEGTRLYGLDDEYALQDAALNQGHAHKGLILIFAGFAEVLESWMLACVFDRDGKYAFCDKARKAFVQCKAQHSDTLFAQAQRCGKNQMCSIGLQQIRRTNVGLEAAGNQRNDVHQVSAGLPPSCLICQFFKRQYVAGFTFGLAHGVTRPFNSSSGQ
jgi:hypothetical protein